jgi:hypothetical protein
LTEHREDVPLVATDDAAPGPGAVTDLFRTALDAMLDSVAIDRAVRDEAGRLVDFEIAYLNPVATS